jgi:predicted PurR-regulated permease PerM
VDNFLRPILLSGKTPLNSLLIFISVLGGIGVFGMLGLVLGPIVVATAATLLKAYMKRESSGRAQAAVLE